MVYEKVLICDACNCEVTKANFTRHTNSKKHKGNIYNSEEAKKEREKRKAKKNFDNERIVSIIKKLESSNISKDDIYFIVHHKDIIATNLN